MFSDVDSLVNRTKDSNVMYMQTICTNLEDLPNILNIAEKYDNIFASCGIHPNEIKEVISHEIDHY